MKRTIFFLLTAVFCLSAAACTPFKAPESLTDSAQFGETTTDPTITEPTTTDEGKTQSDEPASAITPTTYSLGKNTKGVKILGVRNEPSSTWITCDWTCSGFEMNVECAANGDMTFEAKSNAGVYFRAWVDGEIWGDTTPYYIVSNQLSMITLKNIPKGKHTIRLVKVTGHTLGVAQVMNVTFCGSIAETAPAKNERYIEFVGDSICCGWGMIGGHDGDFTAQDGSLAYPYLVANAMNADYSITALSGQGLLMGNPGMTDGYLMTTPYRSKNNAYSFARPADAVVINIGTNDYYYRESEHITAEQFRATYLAFLQTARQKNPQCRVICIYNTMNDTFANEIKSAVSEMGGEESGFYLVEFDRAKNGHPDIAEQAAYAEVLKPIIEHALETPLANNTLVADESGGGMSISYHDFVKTN